MSVDWFDCDVCRESICDCGDYESCNCGKHWCSEECAEVDGFEREHCRLEYDMDDKEENGCTEKYCDDCDNFIETGCKYCREEDFEDKDLLKFALKALGMKRETLIQSYKLHKGGQV